MALYISLIFYENVMIICNLKYLGVKRTLYQIEANKNRLTNNSKDH